MNVGDSVTTDHISPAGAISRTSPAAKYLQERGLKPREFNSYGSRRGNDRIMARGTFANIRLVNKFIEKAGPYTLHFPSNEIVLLYLETFFGGVMTSLILSQWMLFKLLFTYSRV